MLHLNSIRVRFQVHLTQSNNLCLLEDLPCDVHDQHDRKFKIHADKINRAELGTKTRPSLHQHEETVEDDAEIGPHRICPVLEGKKVSLILSLERRPEADGSNTNGDPRELV